MEPDAEARGGATGRRRRRRLGGGTRTAGLPRRAGRGAVGTARSWSRSIWASGAAEAEDLGVRVGNGGCRGVGAEKTKLENGCGLGAKGCGVYNGVIFCGAAFSGERAVPILFVQRRSAYRENKKGEKPTGAAGRRGQSETFSVARNLRLRRSRGNVSRAGL